MKSVGRVAAPPPQNVAPGDEAGGDRRNAPRSTFYDNILGMPLIGTGDRQPVPNDRPSDRQARGVAAAPPNAGEDPDHDAILDEALRAAFVPPERLDSGHLVGAATLMAKQGLTPADAYERFVMQSVRDGGRIRFSCSSPGPPSEPITRPTKTGRRSSLVAKAADTGCVSTARISRPYVSGHDVNVGSRGDSTQPTILGRSPLGRPAPGHVY